MAPRSMRSVMLLVTFTAPVTKGRTVPSGSPTMSSCPSHVAFGAGRVAQRLWFGNSTTARAPGLSASARRRQSAMAARMVVVWSVRPNLMP